MLKILFVLSMLIAPSIQAQDAPPQTGPMWPAIGVFDLKGCEQLDKLLTVHFEGMEMESKKRGNNYYILAKVCLRGVLHVRARMDIVDKQKCIKTQAYTTYTFVGINKDTGKPVVKADFVDVRVLDVADCPTQSAEEDLPKAEKF
jgi:hypothetical protein